MVLTLKTIRMAVELEAEVALGVGVVVPMLEQVQAGVVLTLEEAQVLLTLVVAQHLFLDMVAVPRCQQEHLQASTQPDQD